MSTPAPLIVHVVYSFSVGGLENGLVNLLNRMPAQRWRHAVLSLTRVCGGFAERVQRSDVEFIELDKGPGHLVRDYPRLYRLFRRLRPAVVHTRNLAALEAVVPAWAAGVPVRIHGEHGWNRADPDGKRRRYQYVRALYRPFVSRYIALSRHLEDYLERRVGVPSQRVSQIYNGVDTERFRPVQVRGRIEGCPFGQEDFVVGWVGRMDPVKDLPNLVRAFARATQRSASRLRLALVGDGPMRPAVERLVQQEGLAERVWLAGERADIAEVMRGLDCFVLPSLGEGISNTILEAMATRLPVIATRVGGNAELIESGLTGLLVPPADNDALADALGQYSTDRAIARRHAKAARRVAQSRFSLARMVTDYCSLYETALAAAGVTVPPAAEALSTR
ncbi:MAG TPA: TIGR03088 family PEP-CTERM/XrtA system glycosyltransferase [Burkholderiales bacterium]|jgi:sugar transferase (PEP-CTERM/EpsH1 system associated)